jgi:hypothetical protein
MSISPSRPRVFLIDFEVAIEASPLAARSEMGDTGVRTPEYISGKPYSPFKLDIWQMASSFVGDTRWWW